MRDPLSQTPPLLSDSLQASVLPTIRRPEAGEVPSIIDGPPSPSNRAKTVRRLSLDEGWCESLTRPESFYFAFQSKQLLFQR